MPAQAYEIVAMGARYWFAFLGVIIVWRSFMWLRKDAKIRRKRLKKLPDAGLVGELVVLAGSEALPPGTVIPLPREGSLGNLRSCDVSIPCSGVAARHGDFRFENGVGPILTPAPQLNFMVDGMEPEPGQREWVMHHGSRLVIGDALWRMRLFMGLETARSAAFQQDEEEEQSPQMVAIQQDWQEEDGDLPSGYDAPAPVVMEEDFAPGWEEETRPMRQQILSWQDTGRHTYFRQQHPFSQPQEEPEEVVDQWPAPYPYEEERPVTGEWQQPDRSQAPPPRRSLIHRRRR